MFETSCTTPPMKSRERPIILHGERQYVMGNVLLREDQANSFSQSCRIPSGHECGLATGGRYSAGDRRSKTRHSMSKYIRKILRIK